MAPLRTVSKEKRPANLSASPEAFQCTGTVSGMNGRRSR